MKDASLAMRYSPKLELVSHTSYNCPFHRLCKDIGVAIRGLMIWHAIFVVEYGDHNLVLGQLFLNLVKLS